MTIWSDDKKLGDVEVYRGLEGEVGNRDLVLEQDGECVVLTPGMLVEFLKALSREHTGGGDAAR